MDEHETYIGIKTAKLLKQAGFDWECGMCYSVDSPTIIDNSHCTCDWNCYENSYSAPTLAVAQKWLREEMRYHVEAYLYFGLKDIRSVKEDQYTASIISPSDVSQKEIYDVSEVFDTYEDALEVALQKCLKLILEEKEYE